MHCMPFLWTAFKKLIHCFLVYYIFNNQTLFEQESEFLILEVLDRLNTIYVLYSIYCFAMGMLCVAQLIYFNYLSSWTQNKLQQKFFMIFSLVNTVLILVFTKVCLDDQFKFIMCSLDKKLFYDSLDNLGNHKCLP